MHATLVMQQGCTQSCEFGKSAEFHNFGDEKLFLFCATFQLNENSYGQVFEPADALHIMGPEPLEAGKADQYVVTGNHHLFLLLTKTGL